VELAEWLMYEPHVKIGRVSGSGATFSLKMKVLRKHHYYMSNVIVMMAGITTLAFFSFLFEPAMWEQKSSYCATLLLTSVAFKFVVDSSLPKVSFTTILDLYMLVAFGTMIAVLVQAALIKAVARLELVSGNNLRTFDAALATALACWWLFWNAGYFWRFYHFEREQRHILGEPLSHIITNKPSPGSCYSFLCCHKGEDADSDEEADSDSDKDLPDEDMVKDLRELTSCCTGMEIADPAGKVLTEAKEGKVQEGEPPGCPGWVRDERGLLRPAMTVEMANGVREPAEPAAPSPSQQLWPSRLPFDRTPRHRQFSF